jgi:hypothetical protein
MCRKFFFDDVEHPEAKEWKSIGFVYIFIVDNSYRISGNKHMEFYHA